MTTEDLPPEIGALLASLTDLIPSKNVSPVPATDLPARPATPPQEPPSNDERVAFARAIDDVVHTLSLLTERDWTRKAVNALTVGELVGHLIGTQRSMAVEFGLIAPDGISSNAADHIESTRLAIAAGAAATPADAAGEFARVSELLTTYVEGLDEHGLESESQFGPIVAGVRFLLIVRVFELWTHDNDLRRAVGLSRAEPDPDRLWMMTRAVMPIVDQMGGDRLRIVLTGAGGGVWPAQSEEVAEVALDSVEFCRRVANRISLEHLKADVDGDVDAANQLLTDLATLALD